MLAFAVYKNGEPLEKWPAEAGKQAWCLYLADATGRPRESSCDFDYARLAMHCPEAVERRLFTRYPMPSFGDPILRTRLLTSGRKLRSLSVELALGRLELIDEQSGRGGAASDKLSRQIEQARALAVRAQEMDAAGERAAAAAVADESLDISVPAGEALALEAAQDGLQRRRDANGLSGFLFGCTAVGADAPEKRRKHYLELFNYCTIGFYLNGMEPEPGVVHHEAAMVIAQDLHSHGFQLKGHPLVWTYSPCLPPHRRGLDFSACCDAARERIERDVPPFNGLIRYWDVINEAHDVPWANSFGFNSEQMIELTGLAAAVTRRKASPDAKLVVNVCLPFGEYAAGASGRATTLEYVRGCIDAGVDFDIIGIQFYFGGGLFQYCWDMLEISRILDEYAALGKEIHITELGTPSAMGPDSNALISEDNLVGFWHREWSESTQADWVEQFYSICMAKPAINALTWWSFSEFGHVFWPHGGLLNRQDDPKEAFRRLLKLRKFTMGQ